MQNSKSGRTLAGEGEATEALQDNSELYNRALSCRPLGLTIEKDLAGPKARLPWWSATLQNGGGAEHPRSERWSFPCLFCGTQVTRVRIPCLFCGTQVTRVRIPIRTEGMQSTPGVRGGASPAYSAVPKSRELSDPFERRWCRAPPE